MTTSSATNQADGTIDRRTFLGAMGAAAWIVLDPPALALGAEPDAPRSPGEKILLRDGWRMQSAAKIEFAGEGAPPPTADWYTVSVPSTVLAGLVASGEYPDIYYGENLNEVPKDRFKGSWWYQKEFSLPELGGSAGQVWLHFEGINYRANIWLNGKKIGDADKIVGTYRDFELNITDAVHRTGANVLSVEVLPPGKGDLTITFVDWAPKVPDQNMGLWQNAALRTSGAIALRHPHVTTDLVLPSLAKARLTVMVDAVNPTGEAVRAVVQGQIEKIKFSQEVQIPAGATQTITFTPQQYPQLEIEQPRVWWPWQLGSPEMYELKLDVAVNGTRSDQASTNFGIRHVTSRLQDGHLLFTVNGVDLLIVGGGYAPDLLQRRSLPGRPNWQEDQLRYLRDMNLNTVRLEGKLEDDAFYDLCDRLGILVMAGWCCCSPWEQWKNWKEEQTTVAMESLRYQIRRARTHPSMLAWLNGSDNPPPPDIERQYLAIEEELKWPCPTISSATAKEAASGPSGVKMNGPYKWVPPNYWLSDTKNGGAWGFNTEVGPGAVPPPLESLEAMLPPDHRWPIDKVWDFHGGGGAFKSIADFTGAMDERFGKSTGLADFSWKAQAQAYETIRAMYEGFRANKFKATGEIQWMLNNAWPSMIWHLYDYYLRPGAAYFATKLACEPLHVMFRYDNRTVVVANDSLKSFGDLTVSADIYDTSGKLVDRHEAMCAAPPNSATPTLTLAKPDNISTTYFARLTLKDKAGQVLSVNSYWLSTKPDVLNWEKSDWNVTPCTSFADYTLLEKLPRVDLSCELLGRDRDGDEEVARVRVTNNSDAIALLVRTKIVKGSGKEPELLPIRWSDNYFMLLPHETRGITARYLLTDLLWAAPQVVVDCFNNGRS